MLGRQAVAVTVMTVMTATTVMTTATTADAADVVMAPVAIWRMNEGPGARVMLDSSGHRLNGSIIVSAHHRINDGNWHTVRCDRTASRVAMTIDGVGEAYRNGATGTISNTWPVSIGGKVNCDQVKVGCDYYAGDLDQVEIDAR